MFRARSSRVLPSVALSLALVAPLACTKDQEESPKSEAKAAAEGDAPAPEVAPSDGPVAKGEVPPTGGLTKAITDGVAAAATGGRLDRGSGLAHFVLPNPSALLEDVRTKAAPPKGAAFLNEAMLRNIAGMQLGARASVAQHIALDKPMGCVVVEDTAVEVPLACIVGYAGGAAAVAADLGAEGQQSDAGEHVAHYRIGGNEVYLDDLAGQVVISSHAAAFGKARGYLETNMLGRAAEIADDIEIVIYPRAAMTRYSKQVDALLSMMQSIPKPPSGSPIADAFTDYSRSSLDRSLDFYRETDQVDLGVGLEEVGLAFRLAIFPTPGSGTQADVQAITSGPINQDLVKALPAETFMVSAYTVDWNAAWSMEGVATVRDVLIDGYATAVGRDAAEVRSGLEAYLTDNAKLYGNDIAMALVHLPGTQGAIIFSRALDDPGRASWKTWSEGFTPERILGPEGLEQVTWSFQPDALEVDGVAVDRWTIEPGPASKAKIAKDASPVVAELERRFGGLKLVIDRVELDDRCLFVIAPGAQEQYIRVALEAAKGGKSLGSDAGLAALFSRHPNPSAIMAFDLSGALGWAREVLPPEATAKIPPALGTDLSDFYVSISYESSGAQRGEMVLSQAMIDQLRNLAG